MTNILDFPHPIADIAQRQARIRTVLQRIDNIIAELHKPAGGIA